MTDRTIVGFGEDQWLRGEGVVIRFDKLPTNTVILIAWALTAHLARNVACAQPQDDDQTIEWVVREYPDRVKRLVERLDLGRAELQVVQQAADKNDLVRACRLLLDHYRDGNSAVWLRGGVVRPGDGTDARAELHLNDSFHWHATTGKVPRRDGHLDWSYTGPKNSAEWGYNLNRHYHLDHLLNVYVRTGNPRYASRIDADIRDWVISNPYPARNDARDRPQWRGLEVYFRVIHWAKIFFRLQNDPLLSDATRILILTSVSEHADYLRKYHADSGNWITMEMEGLATAGACWLEFRDASAWLSYAVRTTIEQAQTQAYPDGAQKELSYDYHNVALKSLLTTVDTARRGGAELPPDFQHFLETNKIENKSRLVEFLTAQSRGNYPVMAVDGLFAAIGKAQLMFRRESRLNGYRKQYKTPTRV